MGVGAYWRCPICLRRVPDKVVECYCGRRRQPGDGPDAGDAKPERAAAARVAVALLALLALGVVLARGFRRPAAPASTPATTVAPEAGDSALATGVPAGGFEPRDAPAHGGSAPAPASRAAEPPPSTVSSPGPTPTPEDSLDARREQGRLAFENAMRNLQGRAEVLQRRLDNLARSCPPEATQVVGCDALREEIARDAREIRAAADEAEEAARRGWVDPGAIRDARERHTLREGDLLALMARVDEALRR